MDDTVTYVTQPFLDRKLAELPAGALQVIPVTADLNDYIIPGMWLIDNVTDTGSYPINMPPADSCGSMSILTVVGGLYNDGQRTRLTQSLTSPDRVEGVTIFNRQYDSENSDDGWGAWTLAGLFIHSKTSEIPVQESSFSIDSTNNGNIIVAYAENTSFTLDDNAPYDVTVVDHTGTCTFIPNTDVGLIVPPGKAAISAGPGSTIRIIAINDGNDRYLTGDLENA